MGLLDGFMIGVGNAANTYGENRTFDIREAARKQADLDKEERIREASREDAALARTNKMEDYQMVRKDAIADEANKYALDHSPERIDNARSEKLASMQDETDFNNKNWETKLSQATQLHNATKPVDHFDQREQDLKIRGLQKTLDSVNIPDSVKEDNKAYKDQIIANKSTRTAMQAQGTYDDKAKKTLDDADAVALAQIHDNLKPYMPKMDDPMGFNSSKSDWGGKGENDKDQYETSFKSASATHGVPLSILKAVGKVESNMRQFDENGEPVNPGTSSATGVMQVIHRWHPKYDKEKLNSDPNYNINAGAEILREYYDQTDPKLPSNERTSLALQKYYGSKDEAENIAYANKVMGVSKQFSAESVATESNRTVTAKEDPKPSAKESVASQDRESIPEQPPRGLLNAIQASGGSSRTPSGMLNNASDSINLIKDRMDFLKDKSIEFKNAFSHMPLNEQMAELKKAGY